MRRILLLLFAVVLIASGVYLMLSSAAHLSIYGLARGIGPGAILAGLGGYLIWDDFLAPLLRAGAGGNDA